MQAAHKNHRWSDFWTTACVTGLSLAVGLSVAVIRRRKTCPLCRGRVEGELESIQLSVVCKDCTIQYFKSKNARDAYLYTMSESAAIQKSGCLHKDLSGLNYQNYGDCKMERYYLRSEALFMRNLRRKDTVEKALGFKLKDINPVIRHFLLGDYLALSTETTTKLEDVLKYKDVTHRASEITKHCRSAHPQAVLDFCVENPTASPSEFKEMRHKMKKIFLLEGRRILHGLDKLDREQLKDGALQDVYESFYAEESNRLIRGYLIHWFDETTVEKIMADDGWVNFDWACGAEDRVATHLKAFWKEKLHRKEALEKALQERGLSMSDACEYCKDYLNGVGNLDLSAVVACVDLARQLMKLDISKDFIEWTIGFSKMLHLLTVLNKEPAYAVKTAVESVLEEIAAQNQVEEAIEFEEFW